MIFWNREHPTGKDHGLIYVLGWSNGPESGVDGIYRDKAVAKSIGRHLNKARTSKYSSQHFVSVYRVE